MSNTALFSDYREGTKCLTCGRGTMQHQVLRDQHYLLHGKYASVKKAHRLECTHCGDRIYPLAEFARWDT